MEKIKLLEIQYKIYLVLDMQKRFSVFIILYYRL